MLSVGRSAANWAKGCQKVSENAAALKGEMVGSVSKPVRSRYTENL